MTQPQFLGHEAALHHLQLAEVQLGHQRAGQHGARLACRIMSWTVLTVAAILDTKACPMDDGEMSTWTGFTYRGFHDVPRAVVVPLPSGPRILLVSKFDEDLDDYDDHYNVYLLPEDVALDGSWDRLCDDASRVIGRVRVADVRFDPSRRQELDLDSLRLPRAVLSGP